MADRWICAGLMLAGGVLLALCLRPRQARIAWAVLLVCGLSNALVLSFQTSNLININLVHHYLGAKYPIPYGNFYRAFNAAAGRPQINMRDLDAPPAMLRADPREQRAYYIDLMREANIAFEPLVSLPALLDTAIASGVLATEAEQILAANLPRDRIDDFKADVQRAYQDLGWQRDLTSDYGFNGSPFYSTLRQADPTLGSPFHVLTAVLNLLWQVGATLLLAWIAGAALSLQSHERMAVAALLFASWDFVGWALPGLIFAGLWLPVALALYAVQRGRPGLAGFAIAWAGLIKLFPFVMLLPAAAAGMRRILPSGRTEDTRGASRQAWTLIIWAVAGVIVLGTIAFLSGRSWTDFLHKIFVQFQSGAYLLNSVSLSQGLFTIGIHGSPLPRLLAVFAWLVLVVLCFRSSNGDPGSDWPRRMLVLVAASGWFIQTWFNYYAIAPLILLPALARDYRWTSAAMAVTMAVAFVLPEFDDPALLSLPYLHALKVTPYVLIPAVLVWWEFRDVMPKTKRMHRIAILTALVCLAAVAGESWRLNLVRQLDRAGGQALDQGNTQAALARFSRLVSLAPRNGMAHMNQAIALATAGQLEAAGASFAKAAKLAPESEEAQYNYGRWLAGEGRLAAAADQFQVASRLAPHDQDILADLARVVRAMGEDERARKLFVRALELDPQNQRIRSELGRLSETDPLPGP